MTHISSARTRTAIAALNKLRQSGFLGKADRILIYNTGSGYKYLEAWKQ